MHFYNAVIGKVVGNRRGGGVCEVIDLSSYWTRVEDAVQAFKWLTAEMEKLS